MADEADLATAPDEPLERSLLACIPELRLGIASGTVLPQDSSPLCSMDGDKVVLAESVDLARKWLTAAPPSDDFTDIMVINSFAAIPGTGMIYVEHDPSIGASRLYHTHVKPFLAERMPLSRLRVLRHFVTSRPPQTSEARRRWPAWNSFNPEKLWIMPRTWMFRPDSGHARLLVLDLSLSRVKGIPSSAFITAVLLEVVNFPPTLTHIEKDAFRSTRLCLVDLTPCSELSVLEGAFSKCTNLDMVLLPHCVQSMGEAFSGTAISWIDLRFMDKLTQISGAFRECTALEFAFLPLSLEAIGEDAFRDCWSLNLVTWKRQGCIRETAFLGCLMFRRFKAEIVFSCNIPYPPPMCATGDRVEAERTDLEHFGGCPPITYFSLPLTVGLQQRAARPLTGLAPSDPSFDFVPWDGFVPTQRKDLRSLCLSGFDMGEIPMAYCYGCANLRRVMLPPICTGLGADAFGGCRTLYSIDLHATRVRRIGYACFLGDWCLGQVSLPASLEEVEDRAFLGCGLTSFDASGTRLLLVGSLALSVCPHLRNVRLPLQADASRDITDGSRSARLVTAGTEFGNDIELDEVRWLSGRPSFWGKEHIGNARFYSEGVLASSLYPMLTRPLPAP